MPRDYLGKRNVVAHLHPGLDGGTPTCRSRWPRAGICHPNGVTDRGSPTHRALWRGLSLSCPFPRPPSSSLNPSAGRGEPESRTGARLPDHPDRTATSVSSLAGPHVASIARVVGTRHEARRPLCVCRSWSSLPEFSLRHLLGFIPIMTHPFLVNPLRIPIQWLIYPSNVLPL